MNHIDQILTAYVVKRCGSARALFQGDGGYGFKPYPHPEIVTKKIDLSFSQTFPHIGSVVLQCRSVYANF